MINPRSCHHNYARRLASKLSAWGGHAQLQKDPCGARVGPGGSASTLRGIA